MQKPVLVLMASLIASTISLAQSPGEENTISNAGDEYIQHVSCRNHKLPEGAICDFCMDGKLEVGKGKAVTFPWTNTQDFDMAILKNGNTQLAIIPGQPAAAAGTSSEFGAKILDSVLWTNSTNPAFIVPRGKQLSFLDTTGAFLLIRKNADYDEKRPALILKITTRVAKLNYENNNIGRSSMRSQCAVFYANN